MSTAYFLPRVFNTSDQYPLTSGDIIDQLFNASFPWKILKDISQNQTNDLNAFTPKIDVLSDDKSYTLQAEIPGVDADKVKLEVKNGALILSGEKLTEKVEGDPKTKHVTERSFGSFYRELTLPEDADSDKISASHKDGVLSVHIPRKTQKEASKSISITRG